MPLLSPAVRAMARHATEKLGLDHTYDLRIVGRITGEDALGYVERGATVDSLGRACHFRDVSTISPDATGLTVLGRPTLLIAGDDPAMEGDTILNVYDATGAVLVAGPLLIENIVDVAPGQDGPISKLLVFRDVIELPR